MTPGIPSELPAYYYEVKLILCGSCGIHTNHRQTKRGEWVCWCGHTDADPEQVRREAAEVAEWLGTE